jgi:hypothetical protein
MNDNTVNSNLMAVISMEIIFFEGSNAIHINRSFLFFVHQSKNVKKTIIFDFVKI